MTPERLGGWGRYPMEPCQVFRPERVAAVAETLAAKAASSFIARGLGRSYGDAALNRDGGVIVHDRLDRMLAFDQATGELSCEAGVSFADLIRWWLPRGWFPPVTPGTKFVTLGGAIAADVHGKNHHRDGTISAFVQELTLLTAEGEHAALLAHGASRRLLGDGGRDGAHRDDPHRPAASARRGVLLAARGLSEGAQPRGDARRVRGER